jgi:hypothetical protein
MSVLFGCVEILGHLCKRSSFFFKIYSPSSESLLSINLDLSAAKQKSSLATILKSENILDKDKIQQACHAIDEWISLDAQCAILLFKQASCGLSGIESMMPIFRSLFSSSQSPQSQQQQQQQSQQQESRAEKLLMPGFAIVNHIHSSDTTNTKQTLYPELKINSDYLSKLKGFGIGTNSVGRGQGSIHCIVGAKNSGKSTMARHLLNSILNRYYCTVL